ncbi:hypothetical protein BC828DRAFT_408120 [Blastocladiella britannica]|nr:hypothetical protein BC828DRAFT_408120 [Blastocladiella britannica]
MLHRNHRRIATVLIILLFSCFAIHTASACWAPSLDAPMPVRAKIKRDDPHRFLKRDPAPIGALLTTSSSTTEISTSSTSSSMSTSTSSISSTTTSATSTSTTSTTTSTTSTTTTSTTTPPVTDSSTQSRQTITTTIDPNAVPASVASSSTTVPVPQSIMPATPTLGPNVAESSSPSLVALIVVPAVLIAGAIVTAGFVYAIRKSVRPDFTLQRRLNARQRMPNLHAGSPLQEHAGLVQFEDDQGAV